MGMVRQVENETMGKIILDIAFPVMIQGNMDRVKCGIVHDIKREKYYEYPRNIEKLIRD